MWDAVKQRQANYEANNSKSSPSTREKLDLNQALRRKKYLLSGLLECGQCGGKLTIAGSGARRRYYCANAKEKGPAVCVGFKGILQTEVEKLVLTGLRDKLLEPKAFEIFVKEFKSHIRSYNKDLENVISQGDKSIRETEDKLRHIISAIENGAFAPALNDRLKALQCELEEKRARREAISSSEVPFPSNLPALYRTYIDDLAKTLAKEAISGRAGEELRSMIQRIEVQYDRQSKHHCIDIEGDIIAMLSAANPSSADEYELSKSSIKLVAGVGFEPTTFRL
ncbi:zinc ribbon domain-containing protein [Pseudaestuariivita rosea]|uniref:zinc ribbon domain-containing protein n=1 Tax=Pseudaestuariivita rosea TaxID=2763263 RepID=UPI001ABA1071